MDAVFCDRRRGCRERAADAHHRVARRAEEVTGVNKYRVTMKNRSGTTETYTTETENEADLKNAVEFFELCGYTEIAIERVTT